MKPYLNEFLSRDEVVLVLLLLQALQVTGGVRDFRLEKTSVILENLHFQSVLSHTRGAHNNQRLVFQGSWVEGMEILFGEDKDIILYEN